MTVSKRERCIKHMCDRERRRRILTNESVCLSPPGHTADRLSDLKLAYCDAFCINVRTALNFGTYYIIIYIIFKFYLQYSTEKDSIFNFFYYICLMNANTLWKVLSYKMTLKIILWCTIIYQEVWFLLCSFHSQWPGRKGGH